MKILTARGPLRWFLLWRGFAAITIPPIGIFFKAERLNDVRLLKHEVCHWHQYQRMGFFGFYWNYFKGFVQHGYWNHPMEIEARKAEKT